MSDPRGCSSPPPMKNSIVTDCRPKILGPGVHIEGTKCYAECNPGYHLSGGGTEYTIACQEGEWVQTEICNADCPSPSSANSSIADCTHQVGSPYLEGTSCTVRCNQDYQLTSSDTEHSIACLGGEWRGIQHCMLKKAVISAEIQIIIIISLVIAIIILSIVVIIFIKKRKSKQQQRTPDNREMDEIDAQSSPATDNGAVYIDPTSAVRNDSETHPLVTESNFPGSPAKSNVHNTSTASNNTGQNWSQVSALEDSITTNNSSDVSSVLTSPHSQGAGRENNVRNTSITSTNTVSTLQVPSTDGKFKEDIPVIDRRNIDRCEIEFLTERDNGECIIVRRIKVSSQSIRRSCESELNWLKALRHTNILQHYTIWHGYNENDFEIYVQIELYQDNLKFWLEENPHPRIRNEALNLLQQVVTGVDYIHDLDYIHGNLKPDSIYMASGIPKIGNFGLVREAALGEYIYDEEIVSQYISPEQAKARINHEPYDKKDADIYALGMIFLEMLESDVYESLLQLLEEEEFPSAEKLIEENWLSVIREKCETILVKDMLNEKPDRRPSTKTILDEMKDV